eukprot:12421048-Karenia_brevis.AAC.1
MWSEIPKYSSDWFDNDHFKTSLQLRLGMVKVPAGTLCQVTKNNGDKCLHSVQDPLVHPHVCKMGPARLRPHRAVMVALQKVCERGGAQVDLERAIPALYRIADD